MLEYFCILLIVISISEFVKRINLLHPYWIPLLNLATACSISLAYFGIETFTSAKIGLVLGLMATGICCTVYCTMLIFE